MPYRISHRQSLTLVEARKRFKLGTGFSKTYDKSISFWQMFLKAKYLFNPTLLVSI